MIDNDPKHVEAAYQAAMHKSDKKLAEKAEKLERENRELRKALEWVEGYYVGGYPDEDDVKDIYYKVVRPALRANKPV